MPLRFDLAFAFAFGPGCSGGGCTIDVDDIQEAVDFPGSSCPDLLESPSMPLVRLDVTENRDRELCGLPEPNVSCDGSPLPLAEPRAPRRAACPTARNFERGDFPLRPWLRELLEVPEKFVSPPAIPRRAAWPTARSFERGDFPLRPGLRELREVPEKFVSLSCPPRASFPTTRNFVSADLFLRPKLRAESGDEDLPARPPFRRGRAMRFPVLLRCPEASPSLSGSGNPGGPRGFSSSSANKPCSRSSITSPRD